MNLIKLIAGTMMIAAPFVYSAHAEEIYMGITAYSVEESTKGASIEEKLANYFPDSISGNDKEFYSSLERISKTEPETAAKIAMKIWPKAAMDLFEKSGYKGLDKKIGTGFTTEILSVFSKQPANYFQKAIKNEKEKKNYKEAIELCEKTAEFYENAARFNEGDEKYSPFYKKKAEKFSKEARKLEKKWAKETYKKLMADRKAEEKNGKSNE
jgi:hypothetical protein